MYLVIATVCACATFLKLIWHFEMSVYYYYYQKRSPWKHSLTLDFSHLLRTLRSVLYDFIFIFILILYCMIWSQDYHLVYIVFGICYCTAF